MLKMESPGSFDEGNLVAFIRMGNDFTQNYYQLEIPLRKSTGSHGRFRKRGLARIQ